MAGYCTQCGGIPGRDCSACDGTGFRKPSRDKAARLATLAKAEASALHLAELCEQKAGLLRDMAEGLAAEAMPTDSAWLRTARDVAANMESRAAKRGQIESYKAQDGQPISVAFVAGRSAWTLSGKAIARRRALGLIAERMAARLG